MGKLAEVGARASLREVSANLTRALEGLEGVPMQTFAGPEVRMHLQELIARAGQIVAAEEFQSASLGREEIQAMFSDDVARLFEAHLDEDAREEWDFRRAEEILEGFVVSAEALDWAQEHATTRPAS